MIHIFLNTQRLFHYTTSLNTQHLFKYTTSLMHNIFNTQHLFNTQQPQYTRSFLINNIFVIHNISCSTQHLLRHNIFEFNSQNLFVEYTMCASMYVCVLKTCVSVCLSVCLSARPSVCVCVSVRVDE